ncbi:MAG: site-specific integrase, partial [Phycisphaerae bacterium]
MARTHSHEFPSYRLHKPKGLAVVRLSGRDIYLGKYGTPESHATYERLIAEWLANGRELPPSKRVEASSVNVFTVNDLILAFMEHA